MSDWQQNVALALAILAIAYLVRTFMRRTAGRSTRACGSCRTCDVGSAPSSPSNLPMVDVRTLVSSREEAAETNSPRTDC